MLGTPTHEEIEKLDSEAARQYVRSLPLREGKELSSRYPWAQGEVLDLLESMIRFDPHKRVTVNQALEHIFVRAVRRPDEEIDAPARIRLDFEDHGEDLNEGCLRQHFCEHVRKVRDAASPAVREASESPGNASKPSWMCSTPACQKPSWNREAGEYCSRQCRARAQKAKASVAGA